MEEATKFYEWLLKMGNIHLADNQGMTKAYRIIYKNNKQLKTQKKCTLSIQNTEDVTSC